MTIALDVHVTCADAAEWDELVQQFPDHTVFHLHAWAQIISENHGARPAMAKATCGDDCVAVWPFLEVWKGPLRVLGSPLPGWSTAYMGPLFDPSLSPQEMQVVFSTFMNHDLLRKHAYLACKVISRGRTLDLTQFGFDHVLDLDTYLIDLTQPSAVVWDNLKSECRTRIRKAEKLGIEVREESDGGFVSDYWSMSLDTFEKSNIQPTHDHEFVGLMWKHLRGGQPGARVRALSAYHGGERIATLVLPFDSHTMYYWGGAAFTRFRQLPSHNLLHWHAILAAQRLGLREYDFICTFGGPGRFKKTFGPRVVPMAVHWEHSPSRLMAALKRGYATYLLKRRRLSKV